MKKILNFINLLLILTSFIFLSSSNKIQANNNFTFSNLSEEECLEFITNKGVNIPDDLTKLPSLGSFVKNCIILLEDNPNTIFSFNNIDTLNLANQIKTVILDYYNDVKEDSITIKTYSTYTLQDSIVYGPWNENYVHYNCYGYAINQTSKYVNPGYYSNKPFSILLSIYNIALLVEDDLYALGYNCVKITSIRPTTIQGDEKVICVRKGNIDYHFMKLSDGVWYHKPGGTAILQYKYLPTKSRIWTNEHSFRNVSYPGTTTYDSDIYYILYNQNHTITSKWTGQHYHSGKQHYYQFERICKLCGYSESKKWEYYFCPGPPCVTPWSYED
ncbi:MAG TPA: hypothetical protein GXZ48_06370 [Acholeplasmataceae bacterium]|nr:hypothetical protein [Acholeplasmataceae bacterium]